MLSVCDRHNKIPSLRSCRSKGRCHVKGRGILMRTLSGVRRAVVQARVPEVACKRAVELAWRRASKSRNHHLIHLSHTLELCISRAVRRASHPDRIPHTTSTVAMSGKSLLASPMRASANTCTCRKRRLRPAHYHLLRPRSPLPSRYVHTRASVDGMTELTISKNMPSRPSPPPTSPPWAFEGRTAPS